MSKGLFFSSPCLLEKAQRLFLQYLSDPCMQTSSSAPYPGRIPLTCNTSDSNGLGDSAKSSACFSRAYSGKKKVKNVTLPKQSKAGLSVVESKSVNSAVTVPVKAEAAKGEGLKVPFHEYSCIWSTFPVPAGCKFPELSTTSQLLELYTPVCTEEDEQLKHQFIYALASSPRWWRNLVSDGPLPRRNEEEALSALTRAHDSRDRSLLDGVTRCMRCPEKKKRAADWVCSCCSVRLCSKCLAPEYLEAHGACVKRGAIGILPEARAAVLPLMGSQEGMTIYCVRESIYLVKADHRGIRMKRDGFCLRQYVSLTDVHARRKARTCTILYHVSFHEQGG